MANPNPATLPWRRYLRQVRHPNVQTWFGWYDPRSWAIADRIRRDQSPSRHDVRDALTIARRGRRAGRFVATMPRSGSHYLMALLNSAHALERGEDGDYDYVPAMRLSGDPAWIPRGQDLCWPAPTASLVHAAAFYGQDRELPSAPVLIGHQPMGHGMFPMHEVAGRPVILTRHPKEAMRSSVRMQGLVDLTTHERRARSMARGYAGWCNTWGAAIAASGQERILQVRYDELVADPGPVLRAIGEHWGMGLTPSSIDGAVELCGRARMEGKTGNDATNVRVTVGTPAPVDPALVASMDAVIDDEVRHPLGYDLGRFASGV